MLEKERMNKIIDLIGNYLHILFDFIREKKRKMND